MESLGEFLKNGRKAKGITLEDINQKSKLRIHYLRWLEGDELDRMPPTTYVKGYVRAYCDTVGLDTAEAFLRYSRQLPRPEPEEEVKPEKPFFTTHKILTGTLVASVFIAVLMVI